MHAAGSIHAAESMHSAGPMHAAESPHTTGAMHTTEAMHATARERAAVKARSDERDVIVTHLMKVIEVVKMMEMIDKDKAHARANEYWRPPPPGVGIGIGRDGVPQHAAILALHNLPSPITLQARTSGDLLHRPIDFRLPDNSSAIRAVHAVGRHRLLVIRLRECRRSEAETDEQCPETKQFVHDVWPHESPTFSTSCHRRHPAHRCACANSRRGPGCGRDLPLGTWLPEE